MGTEKQGKSRANNGAVREELVQELKHLRTLVCDVGEQFILRCEGEIETIISHLAALPPRELKASAPEWLREIHNLRLKPAKGRLKDLKGIDRLIGELADRVVSGQDGKK